MAESDCNSQEVSCASTDESQHTFELVEYLECSDQTEERSCATTPESFTPNLLIKILEKTESGKQIIQRANAAELSETSQLKLSEIIAKYHISLKKKTTACDLDNYSSTIVALFKSERKENYYIPRGGDRRNHGGKIANKIGNIRQTLKRKELKEAEHIKRLKPDADSATDDTLVDTEVVDWLRLNHEPWSTVLDKWAKSFSFRQRSLRNLKCVRHLVKDFPHYQNPFGYQLIDLDFTQLFCDAPKGLEKFIAIGGKLKTYFKQRSHDPSAVDLLPLLENSNEDTRICALLLLLNTVLPPISAAVRYKPTIAVAQEDTIVFVENEEDVASKVDYVNEAYRDHNLPPAPKLVFLGSGINNLSGKYLVVYGDIRYELSSAARATDVLIKLTAVFNLPYAKLSKLVWHFLSGVVYGIPQRESYASINQLRNFLTTSYIDEA